MLKRYELILQFFCQLPLLALYAVYVTHSKLLGLKICGPNLKWKELRLLSYGILLKNIQKYRF